MSKQLSYPTITHPKTLLVGIYAPYNKTKDIQSYYDEFVHLIKSNNIAYDHSLFIKLREVDSAYFITKGKVEDIRAFCEEHKIEEIIISEALTPLQERNLSELFHATVFDRTQLILEIFEKNAHSGEGKLQVEIALLQHKKSRLAGKGIFMNQQSGHRFAKGPGETAKEKELRHIENHILVLKKHLDQLDKTRTTQRQKRLELKIPHVCLIGYTNTGKSTILNQLTNAQVLAKDQLFATLETTTRELFINGKKKGIISDTVGFIQQLPHALIEAFKSTLDELQYADLLLHIVDAADKNWQEHIAVVHAILKELGIEKDMLYVFNKIEKADETEQLLREKYQPSVSISAKSKDGIKPLVEYLTDWNVKKLT